MESEKTPEQVAEQAQASTNGVLAVAEAYVIDSPEMYQLGGDELKNIKKKYKEIESLRVSITKPMDEAKKKVMDMFRRPLETLDKAERMLKARLLEYDQEQERIRREAEAAARKAQAEPRRKAEAEAAEARRKAEEASDAEAKAKAEAEAAEAAAKAEVAAATPAPIVAGSTPKVAGLSKRKTYSAEVEDLQALCKAVLEGTAPANVIVADMKVLNGMARTLKDAFNVPGVKLVATEGLSSRSS
jgi:membrane protein involved in colicin uptake